MNRRVFKLFKRLMDLGVALVLLILLMPLFLFVTLTMFILNDGHPFFLQERPGKNGKTFTLIKFKTMTDEKNAQGELLPDFKRTTKMGNFLRSYSIDELPQLLNVLKGDMSFVGPRPLLVKYLPLYNEYQARRHEVKPGITGWAQVNGRNATTWGQRFKHDVFYVENQTLGLDLQILAKTVVKVLRREDINAGSNKTMKEFTGNK